MGVETLPMHALGNWLMLPLDLRTKDNGSTLSIYHRAHKQLRKCMFVVHLFPGSDTIPIVYCELLTIKRLYWESINLFINVLVSAARLDSMYLVDNYVRMSWGMNSFLTSRQHTLDHLVPYSDVEH